MSRKPPCFADSPAATRRNAVMIDWSPREFARSRKSSAKTRSHLGIYDNPGGGRQPTNLDAKRVLEY